MYPGELSFIYDGEIKLFSDKQSLRELFKTRPAMQEVLRTALVMDQHNRTHQCKITQKLKVKGQIPQWHRDKTKQQKSNQQDAQIRPTYQIFQ